MEVPFTVESKDGGVNWKATCKDPSLEVEGKDVIVVCKNMSKMIEMWFVSTFRTPNTVSISIPGIKAKIKAEVIVRAEKPLTEFEPVAIPETPAKPKINGPCAYISDGKGVLAVGMCEAASDDPSDTPGIKVDMDGSCMGNYENCTFYKGTGAVTSKPVPVEDDPFAPTQVDSDYMGIDEEEEPVEEQWPEE